MQVAIITRDLKEAAAFARLGIPVEIVANVNERKAEEIISFHLAAGSMDGTIRTARLRHQLKSGELERTVPAHPLLNVLRAYRNHARILDLANDGRFCELRQLPGHQLWEYVPGENGLPGVKPGDIAAIRTRDSHLVAALGLIGFPLLAIAPGDKPGRFLFTVAAVRPGLLAPVNSSTDPGWIMNTWRSDPEALPWEFPVTQALEGLKLKSELAREAERTVRQIILSKPGTRKHAVIRADARGRAWDRVKRHFGGA